MPETFINFALFDALVWWPSGSNQRLRNKDFITEKANLDFLYSGHTNSMLKIGDYHYLAVKEAETSASYDAVVLRSKDGIAWHEWVRYSSSIAMDSNDAQIGIAYAEGSRELILHFFNITNHTVVYYDMETRAQTAIFNLTSDNFGNFAINRNDFAVQISVDSSDNLRYKTINRSVSEVANGTIKTGSFEIACIVWSDKDKLFHLIATQTTATTPHYLQYEPLTDTWTDKTSTDSPTTKNLLVASSEDPALSMIALPGGNIALAYQDNLSAGVYLNIWNGAKWLGEEQIRSSLPQISFRLVTVDDEIYLLTAGGTSDIIVTRRLGPEEYFEASLGSDTVVGATPESGQIANETANFIDIDREETLMEAGKFNLVIEQGSTFDKVFEWLDEDGAKVDLSNFRAAFEIRENVGGTRLLQASTGNGMITIDDTEDTITFDIPAATTEALSFNTAIYNLELYKEGAVSASEAGSWSSTTFDVDNGSSKGELTANGGTPFSGFSVGDIVMVTITTANFTDFGGLYEIDAVTDTVMTFKTLLNASADGAGSTDITILTMDTSQFIRLAEGIVELSREVLETDI